MLTTVEIKDDLFRKCVIGDLLSSKSGLIRLIGALKKWLPMLT